MKKPRYTDQQMPRRSLHFRDRRPEQATGAATGYNEARPYSALGRSPLWEFAAAQQLTRTARGDILNLETVYFRAAVPCA